MFFYLFIMFFVLVFASLLKFSRTKKQVFCIKSLIFLLLFIPAALRFQPGEDYIRYLNTYYELKEGWKLPELEIGYRLLVKLVILFKLHPQCIFVFFSAFTYLFILKCENKVFFPIILVYLVFWFFPSLVIIRNALSFSLSFYSLYYYLNGKRKKWVIYILLACMFHNTAFIYVLIYFLGEYITFSKRKVLLMAIIVIILGNILTIPVLCTILSPVLSEKYLFYLRGDYALGFATSNLGLGILLRRGLLFSSFCLVDKKFIKSEKEYTIISFSFILLIICEVYLFSFPAIYRLMYIGSLYYFLVFKNLYYNNRNYSIILYKIIFIIFLFILNTYLPFNKSPSLIPYQTFWGKDFNEYNRFY